MQKLRSYYPFRIGSDLFLLAASFIVSAYFAKHRVFPETVFWSLERRELFMLAGLFVVWYFSTRMTGLYDEFRSHILSYELIGVLKNCFTQLAASVFILFIVKTLFLNRYFIVFNFLLQVILLSLWKICFQAVLRWLGKKGYHLHSLLVVGGGKVGRDFFQMVNSLPHLGYRIAGFLDDKEKPDLGGLYLGSIDSLDGVLGEKAVEEVVIALPNDAVERIDQVISVCENHTTPVRIIPDYFRFISPRFDVSIFGKFPIITLRTNPMDEFPWRILKRSFDIVFTLVLFGLVFVWLWPLIAVAVKLDSKGPVFFKQERWGRKNKKIVCYKFRSMVRDSKDFDDDGRYLQAAKDDPRITRVGGFLRKTSLDELPQFLNVLKGEMSVVGPRPHPTPLNIESKDKIRHYMLRHLVKPGITGWAQVNGLRGETKDPVLMQKRVDSDLWYIENWTFWLDIQIIFYTLRRMIKSDPNAF